MATYLGCDFSRTALRGGVTNLDVPVVRVGRGATRVGGGCRRLRLLRNKLTRHTPP
ncbi:Uncharacterised protein [Mycobacteroides abscessus subsp. abscessus]|nr:Uncharacterised protein [Mycobacteroides abscessus subsp. abscessus]